MATPAVGVEYTSRNSIDITKMMRGARAAKSGSAKLFLVRSAEEAQLTLEGM